MGYVATGRVSMTGHQQLNTITLACHHKVNFIVSANAHDPHEANARAPTVP